MTTWFTSRKLSIQLIFFFAMILIIFSFSQQDTINDIISVDSIPIPQDSSKMVNKKIANMDNDLIKTVLELSKEYNVNFLFSGYLLVDDYESCVNDMKATPSVNEPWYGGYNVLKRFYFSIKNGVATKTATELLNSMDSESGGELNGIFR